MSGEKWSIDDTLRFLEVYQGEPCIWNPKDKGHKDKKKVADAWNRLSEILKVSVKELKNKKEILMVTFRKHLKKKQESIRSGSGAGEIYEPTWFAYRLMESFLLPVYTSNTGLNSETQSTPEQEGNEMENETEMTENHNNLEGPSISIAASSSTSSRNKSTEKTRRRPSPHDMAEQQMASAFSQLTNALSLRSSPSEAVKEDDECDLYAKLLAKKIRELPKDDRKLMMYEIDGLFIKRIKRRSFSRDTPSPNNFEPYANSYTASRPSTAQTSYSEPITRIRNRPPRVQSSFSDSASIIISPNQTSSDQSCSYLPVTMNIVPNHERTSALLPPSAQNIEDNITIYATQPNSLNASSNSIKILSDEIIVPSQNNIINQAVQNAFENFESQNIE